MYINKTNENHFQYAQYGYYEQDLITEFKLKPQAFMLYVLLKDRLSLSTKNKNAYCDHKGYFVKFSQTSLGQITQMTPKTVGKWMEDLKEKGLIDFEQDKVGKSYKIRIVAYDYKNKRTVKTYNQECFDLDAEIKKLSAERTALLDEKIILMDEVNKLNKQIELQKRCLQQSQQAEIITDASNHTPDSTQPSTSVKTTEGTTVISTDELTNAITSMFKTSIYPSILKDLENTIADSISQALSSKHDGLIDNNSPMVNPPEKESPKPSEDYTFVQNYYAELMGFAELWDEATTESERTTVATFHDVVVDMHFSNNMQFKGSEVAQQRIRAVLARMTYWQMKDALETYDNLTIKVKDHRSYIKSMIYNSILSYDVKMKNIVNHDMHQYAINKASQQSAPEPEDRMSEQLKASGLWE